MPQHSPAPRFTSLGGHDLSKPIPYDPSAELETQIQDSFNNSLKNLRTSYIDSYILHSPLDTLARTLQAWKVLMALQEASHGGGLALPETVSHRHRSVQFLTGCRGPVGTGGYSIWKRVTMRSFDTTPTLTAGAWCTTNTVLVVLIN